MEETARAVGMAAAGEWRLPGLVRPGQALYYLLGGLWPFVHFRSFQAVAGPKPDRFQTEVTAALFAATGAALLAARDPEPGAATAARLLAAGAACGVAVVDWRHRKVIRPLFRAEAALEVAFAVAAVVRSGSRRGATNDHPRRPVQRRAGGGARRRLRPGRPRAGRSRGRLGQRVNGDACCRPCPWGFPG